jgi:hypothetical protein
LNIPANIKEDPLGFLWGTSSTLWNDVSIPPPFNATDSLASNTLAFTDAAKKDGMHGVGFFVGEGLGELSQLVLTAGVGSEIKNVVRSAVKSIGKFKGLTRTKAGTKSAGGGQGPGTGGNNVRFSGSTEKLQNLRTVNTNKKSFVEMMDSKDAMRYNEFWRSNAPKYSTPGTKIEHYKLKGNVLERSTVIYDHAGRQQYRIDFNNHGRVDHSKPHLHEYVYGPSSPMGQEFRYNFWR